MVGAWLTVSPLGKLTIEAGAKITALTDGENAGAVYNSGTVTNNGGTLRFGSSYLTNGVTTLSGTSTCYGCYRQNFVNTNGINVCP